jgi:hypothetical protein
MLGKISSAFSAGALGGLVNGIAVWFFGNAGITAMLAVKIHPALTPSFLYQRMVWGGIWGFLFLIPVLKKSIILRGIIYSLGPSLVTMFIVFPGAGLGVYGLSLGTLTPVFVLFFNAVWGILAALWFRLSAE